MAYARALGVLLALALLAPAPAAFAQATALDLQLSPSMGIARAPNAGGAANADGSFRIAAGDRVTVTVYQEPDLGVVDAKVGSEGSIAFPLLGDLNVAGLTSKELQSLVTRRLADGYLKQPNVTVNVDRQQLYFIKGEVAAPGGYTFVDGLTVEKAIALAGGYTERASKRGITLVREGSQGAPLNDASPRTRVQPGDVITIEESFF